jgi:hypothetical protein
MILVAYERSLNPTSERFSFSFDYFLLFACVKQTPALKRESDTY